MSVAERLNELLARLPRGEPVPAISIRQPWATAIFLLGKDVENRRNWQFKYRGTIIIHASRARMSRADIEEALEIARVDDVPASRLRRLRPRDNTYDRTVFPDGILGFADLSDVFGPDDEVPEDHPITVSPWTQEDANYWLYLRKPVPVTPIPFPGAVGLFKIPYATVRALRPFGIPK